MLPSQWGDVTQEIVGNGRSLSAQPLDDPVKIDGVPMHDGSRDEAQARRPEALVLEGPVVVLPLKLRRVFAENQEVRVAVNSKNCHRK